MPITTATSSIPAQIPLHPSIIFTYTFFSKSLLVNIGTDAQPPRLATEWACGVPSRGTVPASSTVLFKPANSGAEWTSSVSQRLARRFQTQVQLSLDVPHGLMDGPGSDKLVLEIEKRLVKDLEEHFTR